MEREYYSDDITYCDNLECDVESCERNPGRISLAPVTKTFSFAHLEGTEYCVKKVRDEAVDGGR